MNKHYSKYKTNRFQYKYLKKVHGKRISSKRTTLWKLRYLGTEKDPKEKTYLQKLKNYIWPICYCSSEDFKHPLKNPFKKRNRTPS
jgi:hypothetical protein